MPDLKHLVIHWESVLFHDSWLMSPSRMEIIKQTLAALKELEKLKGGTP